MALQIPPRNKNLNENRSVSVGAALAGELAEAGAREYFRRLNNQNIPDNVVTDMCYQAAVRSIGNYSAIHAKPPTALEI